MTIGSALYTPSLLRQLFLPGMLTLAVFISALLVSAVHARDPDFPALSGRVVDDANILSPSQEKDIEKVLANVEAESTDQIVVVTVGSLQGYAIEDYSVRLARHWKLGQAGKDNGVLLLVAPDERLVRIEVGYGLEGVLPDALAGLIIQQQILPPFRRGKLDEGIIAGIKDIQKVLLGQAEEVANRAKRPENTVITYLPLLFFVFWLVPFLYFLNSLAEVRRIGGRVPGGVVILPEDYGHVHDHWYGPGGFGRRRGGTFGGGFSGGGGSFGGGGASGSW